MLRSEGCKPEVLQATFEVLFVHVKLAVNQSEVAHAGTRPQRAHAVSFDELSLAVVKVQVVERRPKQPQAGSEVLQFSAVSQLLKAMPYMQPVCLLRDCT